MDYLYKKFAKYYDLCYSEKNYDKETKFLQFLIKKNKIKGKKILEVGCGTGGHALFLKKKGFEIIGVDLNQEMLDVAKTKTNKIKFYQGDMRTFKLKEKFDIILCLFSTIHYNQNYEELEKTINNFKEHLNENGLLIFDMGFNEERWEGSHLHVGNWSNKEADLVRFSKSRREGNFGLLDMAYILYKDNKFHFGSEQHKLRIFKTLNVKSLVEKLGFKVNLYESYKNKQWTTKSKKYVVFACLKN